MPTTATPRPRRASVHAAVLLVTLLRAGEALAGEPLHLEVLDDATGRPLDGVQAAVVDSSRRAVRGSFHGTYEGPRETGDTLYVYRRGYDVATLPLAEEARVTVRLRPARGRATVVLLDDAAVAAGWTASVLFRPLGHWPDGPFRDGVDVQPGGDRFDLVVAEGMRTMVFPELPDRSVISWPVGFRARADAVHEVRVDRGRELAVLRGDGVALERGRVECLPDVLWDPATDRERVDAWRWHLNGPGWLREELAGRAGTIRVCPDVPFHLFAVSRGTPVYRRVARGDAALDLRGPFLLRAVPARPVIGGEVLPAGGILAPGRLHLDALSTLRDLRDHLGGFLHVAGAEDEAWPDVRLPAAPWLTAWHPRKGVAHLPWEEGVASAGRYGAGAIEVVVARGYAAKGTVAVFPLWKGTGSVRTTPPLRSLARPVPPDGRLRFPGLPLGTYGVSIDVTLRLARTGAEVRAGKWAERTLTREDATAALRLPLR